MALILDISNLAQIAELSAVSETLQTVKETESVQTDRNKVSLLTFKNNETEHFAVPLDIVERIERIRTSEIERIGDNKVVQYRGGALPLYELSQIGDFASLPERENQEVIVFKIKNKNNFNFGLNVY